MKQFFGFLLLLCSCSALAQVPEPAMLWMKGYGDAGGARVESHVNKTPDGGFIVTIGTNTVAGTGNIDSFCSLSGVTTMFLKYNSDATILEWTKCVIGGGDTTLLYLFPTADGGFVYGGMYGGGGFYISKHDALDNIIWGKTYATSTGIGPSDIIATSDGGYIMTGAFLYADTNFTIHYGSWMNADIGIMKLDSQGNKLWSTALGGNSDDVPTKVVEGYNQSCFVLGRTRSDDFDCTGNHGDSSGSWDGYTARLDKDGHLLWHRDLGGTGYDFCNYGVPDGKGGVIVGATSGSHDGDETHQINYNGSTLF